MSAGSPSTVRATPPVWLFGAVAAAAAFTLDRVAQPRPVTHQTQPGRGEPA
jgi:hypothetical protein